MTSLPQLFSEVRLKIDSTIVQSSKSFSRIFKGNTIKRDHNGEDLVATGTFQEIKDIHKKCVNMQTTYTPLKDPRQLEKSVKGHTAGLGSAQSDRFVVEVDDTVMHYIEEKKLDELKAIKKKHEVSINSSENILNFTSQTGKSINAQLAREEFITLYQKVATGLQTRKYSCSPEVIEFCRGEFPELLIIPMRDKKQTKLTGNFISLERFETYLYGSGQRHSLHQTPSKTKHYDTPRTQPVKQEKTTDQAKDETCPICLESFTMLESTVLPKCQHRFCEECLERAFQFKPVCPICGEIYGKLTGTQPKGGQMTVSRDRSSLPGYEGYGTFVITYYIPSGVQGDEHPNPGMMYQGVSRIAYLPDSPEGNKALKLLQRAFDQRITFTIGRSSTTGKNNVVTWNDIHHKTSRNGGPTHYGYPDPEYLNRVQDELKAKGIY